MQTNMTTAAGWSRRDWMGLMATAEAATLLRLSAPLIEGLTHDLLRAPEIGAVMTRGRVGATGAPFNLGEMTVTRCSLRLSEGAVGHGYVQGRDKAKAQTAALIDALMQTTQAEAVAAQVLEPLARDQAEARKARAEKAAATKVDFFTLVRGED